VPEILGKADTDFLESKGYEFEATVDANMICLVIRNYGLPAGYEPRQTDLLLRLPLQFPEVAPDMFWTDPPVHYEGGVLPPATEVVEQHVGRSWQRWSRHFGASHWRAGVDDLRSYIRLIRATLDRERPARAA
jgi:hypothetical protein